MGKRLIGYYQTSETMPDNPKHILIIKPSSLGDIIHAFPTLSAIRKTFPMAHITWLIKKEWAPILADHPMLDDIIEIEFSARKLTQIYNLLRARRFDVVLDLQGLLRTGILSWITRASRRIGFSDAREGSHWFYTERISAPRREIHSVDRYLRLASALGVQKHSAEFILPTSPTEEHRRRTLFSKGLITDASDVVGIAPSSKWVTKRWPAESFAAVADQLQEKSKIRVVFIGSSHESDVAQVKQGMRTPVTDLTGLTTVGDLPAVMRGLRLLITNDSGPMHVAAAVGTPVVAIFGPTSQTCTGPYGDGHIVITASVECRPCFRRRCYNRNINECLTRISVQEVVQAAWRTLQEKRGKNSGVY